VAPATDGTRPATDRVREAVFSSLGDLVVDAAVADLYAGSGSFGLESLSRGAASVVFVENGNKALRALSENILNIGLGGEIKRSSVRPFLQSTTQEFDLVFIDPPWPMSTEDLEGDFLLLERSLRPGGVVIASRRSSDRVPGSPESWLVDAEKRYGDTRIVRYRKEIEQL
jgi:16S rRNA (guanine966-N2)-methyltransferase